MILGREPAAWAVVVKTFVALLALLVVPITADQQGAINALVAVLLAGWVAYRAKADRAFALLVGIVEGGFYVAVAFGVGPSQEVQAVALLFVGSVVALITRDRITAPVDAEGVPR